MWINHVRQWCRDENNARRLRLDPRTLRQVADILVTTSYRTEMPQRLQRIMQRENVCAAQLYADIGDFITADLPTLQRSSALPAGSRKDRLFLARRSNSRCYA